MPLNGRSPVSNSNKMTPKEWFDQATFIYNIISKEIDAAKDKKPFVSAYGNLVIMVEFFRMFRGESFYETRPQGIGEFQKEIYRMEDDLTDRVIQLQQYLNQEDQYVISNLNQFKKIFDLKK